MVLDIGGDVGALVLHVPAALSDREIDLTPLEEGRATTHSAVRERDLAGLTLHAAVYPRLGAGRYRVAGSRQVVTIVGGSVTELTYQMAPGGAARTATLRSSHTRREHVHG
ncbi:MAG: phospholipase [Acidobacteriota bacterium]|nr:phospholipase [Acidobacteriota bacterium]